MRIIPVIDLQDGLVVHAVAGDRARYRRLSSPLVEDAQPGSVAHLYKHFFDFREVYVADLNALSGRDPQHEALRQIAQAGLHLLLDAGLGSLKQLEQLQREVWIDTLSALVVPLESLEESEALGRLLRAIGPERALFSLDMRDGRLRTRVAQWQALKPIEIAKLALTRGFRQLLLLDVADVGVSAGPSVEELCRELRQLDPDARLLTGGGVRDADDLRRLAAAGCDAALVCTALHQGQLTREDIAELNS